MSLLLEALKKAERAKEEAQRHAAPEERRVLTRAELPEISQSFEILSEDLRPEAPTKSQPLALEPEPERSAPSAAPAGNPRTEPAREELRRERERSTARQALELPFDEPDPRRPFFIALGALAIVAIAAIGYFWYQLRPAPAFVTANPPRPANERPADAVALKPASGSSESAPATAKSVLAGLPVPSAVGTMPSQSAPSEGAPPAAAPPAAPEKPSAPVRREPPKAAAAKSASTSRATPKDEPAPQRVARASVIHPQVQAGYAAYQAGDLVAAHASYQQVLRDDPANRDALLGLAAIETLAQRHDLAEGHYRRLLQADPRDPHATAGLLALRSRHADPLQSESRIKTILAGDPEANVLHFALGNQYAQQGRWAEAQQAYAKAYASDVENPDYAFNLAVSHDQLRQPGPALEFYRRALDLAGKRAAHFAPQAARQRVQQLAR